MLQNYLITLFFVNSLQPRKSLSLQHFSKRTLALLSMLFACLIMSFNPSDAIAQKRDKKKKKAKKEQYSETIKEIKVAFYNIENLFDTVDDPDKFDEDFTPDGKLNWTNERYYKKLNNISYVIKELDPAKSGPDVVGLCEVENESVLKDLVKQHGIKARDYQIVHFDSPDERGIDVALLYDAKIFDISSKKNYRITLPSQDSTTRDVLVVQTVLKNNRRDTITFSVNHWPSRRNPEVARTHTAKSIRTIIDSLYQNSPEGRILLMGDFNDEPANASFSILKNGSPELIDAMTDLAAKGEGTYNYRNQWNMLDHFVYSNGLTEGKIEVDPLSIQIFKPEWLQESNPKYKGHPYRTYVGTKYLGGYSDHFPISIQMKVN